ncbi:hypothetical protein ANANG_G00072960 [Anguilla anguilla]|uniref:Chemokine interleukin-8-like domain-containing protein n=1 Tax=Anguilla anguilla TaxID=7936 RepID=A0A9D3S690_ANGAN|nr:hypothetical protein ANANG_G00072960 [Anguilla anguilla]
MITRVLLVIALLASLAHAQSASQGESMGQSRGKCLCSRIREEFGSLRAVLDIQIYPPSHSCDKMEVVVFLINGKQYCLDPKVKKVQELIRHLQSNLFIWHTHPQPHSLAHLRHPLQTEEQTGPPTPTMITRVLLVIALLGCLAHAQYGSSGKCACRRTRERFGSPKAIQDIQIYPPSHTCDKMEIIVFQKNGMQYCLDPKVKKVQELMRLLQSK